MDGRNLSPSRQPQDKKEKNSAISFDYVLHIQKIVVPLYQEKQVQQLKLTHNVPDATNVHLQENPGDEDVPEDVWPEVLHKGRNHRQLRDP